MRKFVFHRALALLLCFLLLSTTTPAHADTLQHDANLLIGGIIAVGAAIVVAVILVVHYKPASVKGCVASGPNGLQLTNSGDKLVYELTGATSDIKSGDVVKVKGKKKLGKGTNPGTFTVKELSKDYGACPATP